MQDENVGDEPAEQGGEGHPCRGPQHHACSAGVGAFGVGDGTEQHADGERNRGDRLVDQQHARDDDGDRDRRAQRSGHCHLRAVGRADTPTDLTKQRHAAP
jgi:hypothetical protein